MTISPYGPSGYTGGNAGTAAGPIGSGPIDYLGNIVPPWQYEYIGRVNFNSSIAGSAYSGNGQKVYFVNPNYNPNWNQGVAAPGTVPTKVPPQYQFTWDTIGQTIFRMIGHCRLPLRYIWVKGVTSSGECTTSPTTTFAAALGAPIDPTETGSISGIFSGDSAIYDPSGGGVIIPDGMSPEDAAAMTASINGATVYPGDEEQLPSPLIVADKGADVTNAFRGIRYIVFENFPLSVLNGSGSGCSGSSGGGISLQWESSGIASSSSAAVEFAAGSA